jgi:ubiquinone/menaquinone biosynthesis C-methylase UbiE
MPDTPEPSDPSPALPTIRDYWDTAAPDFDREPDHGLRKTRVRAAWARRLADWLPAAPSDVLDLGCGTGSLALLSLQAGHRVVGVDLAPSMAAEARAKCAGLPAEFVVGDAAEPAVGGRRFDVVMARHLLWTLTDPVAALRRWVGLTRPGGRLVLVEGRWCPAGAVAPYARGAESMPWAGGVRAVVLVGALEPLVERLELGGLAEDAVLGGRGVDDERYAVVATVATVAGPPTGER